MYPLHPARVYRFTRESVQRYGKPTKWYNMNVDHHDHVEKTCFNHKMAISFCQRLPVTGSLRFPPHVPVPSLAERSERSERVAPQIPNFQESQRPSYVLSLSTKKTKVIIHWGPIRMIPMLNHGLMRGETPSFSELIPPLLRKRKRLKW
jgi:hypothetical protein